MNRVRIVSIISLLLLFHEQCRSGADDEIDTSHQELLLKAIAEGDLEDVKKHAEQVNLKQITNLHYHILGSPNADVVAFLRSRGGFNISDLQVAAIRGDTTKVRQLLRMLDDASKNKALAKSYAPPMQSYSPLALAVRRGHTDAVRELISAGANVNESTRYTLTPLANAAERGHVDIVKLLLQAGANVNSAPDGYTPLMRACIGGQPSTARLLLDAGADLEKKRHDGQRALHFAAKCGSSECVSLLLKHGADTGALAYDKYTPLAYAERYKHQDVVKLLRAAMPNSSPQESN